MMKRIHFILGTLLIITGLSSCSTDFDLNAPYEDRTIVFGLLDQNESLHYIKINKAFLGDGNAFDYATIKDSSEYSSVVGEIQAWNGSTLIATYPLRDTLLTDRDSGLFYYPNQTLYYFTAALNQAYEYRLKLSLLEGTKEVTGSTRLVNDFTIAPPTSSTPIGFGFAYGTSSISNTYPDYTFRYTSGAEGRFYEMWLHIYYEEYTTTDTTRKELIWKLDSYEMTTTNGGEVRDKIINGKSFYQFLASRVGSNAGIIKRVLRQLDLEIVGVNDDFYTYMKVNAPSTGLIQERPAFTNLNNAIGIYASRYTKMVRGKMLNKDSQSELCTGQFTGNLLFCHDSSAFAAESFYCP